MTRPVEGGPEAPAAPGNPAGPGPTPLARRLIRRIAATGPISLADYMAACLADPEHGYYTTGDPLGVAGDFTTSPEISQMFGELLGLALAQSWLDQGRPDPVCLAELGPGRGTLMADAWRAAGAVPGFHAAARVHLVELPGPLRAAQAERLGTARPVWCDHLGDLPRMPLLLLANEFLDALPIRQFHRSGEGWRELQVGLRNGALAFGLSEAVPLAALAHRLADTGEGDVVETAAPAAAAVARVAERIARHGGAAIFADYGDWRSRGDTFQAVKGHAPADPLAAPGAADLTAHVDFEALSLAAQAAAPGLAISTMTSQGVVLERLGIAARATALAARLTGPARAAQLAAHRRLTHPDEMGTLFKMLALSPAGAPPVAGFDIRET